MRWLLFTLLLFGPCCDLRAQIKIQPEYAVGQPVIVSVTFPDAPEKTQPTDVLWTLQGAGGYQPLGPTSIAVWPVFGTDDRVLKIHCAGLLTTEDGKYVTGSHREFDAAAKLLGIGNNPDPGPGPGPEPPPGPNVVPIPEPGFRVLFVYETAARLNQEQLASMFSKEVTDYLNSHCVKGADGKTPEYRRLDPNAQIGPDSGLWGKALARRQASLPWIVISDGKRGYEGPLPESRVKTLELLRKYGGQ